MVHFFIFAPENTNQQRRTIDRRLVLAYGLLATVGEIHQIDWLKRRSVMGHERPICHVRAMSACPPTSDVMLSRSNGRSGPTLKVKIDDQLAPSFKVSRNYATSHLPAAA